MRRDIYLSPSEIWPDKACDLWWEWPSLRRGQLYFGLEKDFLINKSHHREIIGLSLPN
jgi:hypothetical protein